MKSKLLPIIFLSLLFSSCSSAPGSISTSSEESSLTPSSASSEASISSDISSSSEASMSMSSESSSEAKQYDDDPMGDPYVGRQYYLNHIGDIYSAWKQYRGDGQTIAVIDCGFDPYHEDFYYKDGTHKVSDKSASFTTSGNNTQTSVGVDKVVIGEESHGTFCAGVAAAAINGKGVVGVAPNAKLLLLKTDLKPKSIAKAFYYAAENGATVITISIGSYYNYDGDLENDGSDLGTVFDAPVKYCYDKNIPVISAGGNGGQDDMPTEYTFPGCVDYVIGVGGLAANSSTEVWDGSSYNPATTPYYGSSYNPAIANRFIDVFAPADMMFGCCNYGSKKYDGGWKGTSFASPQVAGLAALYFQKNPQATAKQFYSDLSNSCIKLSSASVPVKQLGNGRVDAGKLLGINNKDKITVTLKGSWTSVKAYVWNSITGKKEKEWPGTAIIAKNGSYIYTVDLSAYDSIIFNSGTKQTPDLLASSFIYGGIYSIASSHTENSLTIGVYQ